jgi:two-component system alkaline phosphatase synthesis response regulator PhoP
METKKKILIIDDEPDILEFLSYNFRKHNFEVSTANNGREGIQKTLEVHPEIIISDILMPEMDGIEMCKEIRKNPEFNSTPFLFLTAVNDDYKVLYAMTSGADQFASKPIRFEYLLKIVEDMLSVEADY